MPAATPSHPSVLPCAPDSADDFLSQPTAEATAVLASLPGPVLVLGAGGKMGLQVALTARRALAKVGRADDLLAVSRFQTLRARDEFEQFGLRAVAADLEKPEDLARLPDAPTVIFLAGVKFGTSNSPDLLRRMNEEMPRKVAARFRSARIVALSTGCVYPFMPVAGGGSTEDTPVAPAGAYAESCVARERVFSEAAQLYGTRVALIRLNYSIEFRYGVLVDIAQKVLHDEPIDLTMGHFNAIWQSDAVDHTLRALTLAAAPAVPLNVTSPGTFSTRDVAQRFGRLFGKAPRFTGQEATTAWLNNAAHAHRLFGPPRVNLEQMILWVGAWLQQVGQTWGKPTGFQIRDGKY